MSEMIEHEAAETELSIDTTMERRRFLATPISSFLLRLASTLRAVGATQTVVREVTSVKKLIIPVLKSVDAREKLFDHFGVEAEQFIGGSLEQASSHLVTKKAEQELPFVLESKAFGRGDPRSWDLLEAGHSRDIESVIVREAIQKEGELDSRLGTTEDWIRMLSQDRSIIENAHTALAECIIEEIVHRIKLRLREDIDKAMQKLELRHMHESQFVKWVDVNACIFRAILQMLQCDMGANYNESCLRLLGQVCCEDGVDLCVEHLCLDGMKETFVRLFSDQTEESILFFRKYRLDIKNLLESHQRELSVKKRSKSLRAEGEQEVQQIMQSVQHPFERVMKQISMLADPNYVRMWEQPVPEQSHA